MIQRFLKIASFSEVKQGKNGEYIVVKFEPKYMLKDGTPVGTALSEGTRTAFGPSRNAAGEDIKADGLFKGVADGTYKVGSLIEGALHRVSAYPYTLPGSDRTVSSYTCAVFAHENVREYVNKQLKPLYSCMIDGDYVTAPEQCNKPVNAAAEVEVEADAL